MKPTEMEVIVPLPLSRGLDVQVQQQIKRLQRHCFVELEAVKQFHDWLDDKRHCRQACRVIGDSRTGKTWEEYVLKLPQPSNLTSAAVQKVLGASTRGYLGALDEILRNAARRALQAGQSRIELSVLSQVAAEYK